MSTTKAMHAYGWPDVMRTSIAAQYIGGSRWMILRAVEAGHLTPAGRRGRSFTFTKESLDRFMLGEPHSVQVAMREPGGVRATTRSASSAALGRLSAIREGRR